MLASYPHTEQMMVNGLCKELLGKIVPFPTVLHKFYMAFKFIGSSMSNYRFGGNFKLYV